MRVIVEEGCSLCGVTYPSHLLQRCFRCGRLYCNNCILHDEEGKPICLRCAKKKVSPTVVFRSKYTYLREYLARRGKYASYARLSFRKIEEIIGDKLPPSALHNSKWWSNIRGQSHSYAWLSVGWKVEKVDLEKKEVVFRREAPRQMMKSRRKRRKPVSAAFKALALKPKKSRRKHPSLSKIARAQARIKNIQRRSSGQHALRGIKPRSAYEKRLYKPNEKPE